MKEDTRAKKDWQEFLKGLNGYGREIVVKEKKDFLLATYLDWLKTKEERYKLRILDIALDLEDLGVPIDLTKLFTEK